MNPDDVKKLIERILSTGEILATKAFELALRQVYVEVFQNLAVVLVFLLAIISGVLVYKKAQKSSYGDFWHDAEPLGVFLVVIFGLLVWIPLISGISKLINPEWYAIKILLLSLGIQ